MQCLFLIKESRLDGKTGWRVRHRLQLHQAALANDQRLGVADLVGAHGAPLDGHHGQCRRRPVADCLDCRIGCVDAVEDCRAQQHGFGHRHLQGLG